MSDWKNEDDIKSELRTLTGELKQLREELRAMVSPAPKPNPSRAFLHRQAWPSTPPSRANESAHPPRADEPEPPAKVPPRKSGKHRKG
jgi:hypothetical protein